MEEKYNGYSTATYIKDEISKITGETYKLKDVKSALADEGYMPVNKKVIDPKDSTKAIKRNNLYNVHLASIEPQYTTRNHSSYIKSKQSAKLTTFEGYIYNIKVVKVNYHRSPFVLYLMNEDGEKVIFGESDSFFNNSNGEMKMKHNQYDSSWLNKQAQVDWVRDRSRKGEPILGLHLKVEGKVSRNSFNIENSYQLIWDKTSQHIADVYAAKQDEYEPAIPIGKVA